MPLTSYLRSVASLPLTPIRVIGLSPTPSDKWPPVYARREQAEGQTENAYVGQTTSSGATMQMALWRGECSVFGLNVMSCV